MTEPQTKAVAKKTRTTPTPRAIGDDAVAAGFPVVAGGAPVRDGENEINLTRDLVAQQAKRTGPRIDIYVQPTAPAHAAGRVWIKTTQADMVDYTKPTGNAGTLIIRDNGTTVELRIKCTDGATNVGSLPWTAKVNGGNPGGNVALPAGFGEKLVATYTVTTTQTVEFAIAASGTSGLGGPTTITAAINRGPAPTAPGPPIPLGFSDVTTTSFHYLWQYGTTGGSPITSRAVEYATSEDFSSGSSGWFAVDVSGDVPITGLTPGVLYYVHVRVQNAVGLSPPSPTTSQRTLGGVYVSDGSAWKPAEVAVSDGTTWKPATVGVSDGSAWKPTG